jgi:xanthine/uracil permease
MSEIARPEKWAAFVAIIMMVVGMTAWLFSILPLQFLAGAGLLMLSIWVGYVALLKHRYEAFLRRSITFD